jgi:bifunctional non-homologous end joining protein LigD
VNRQRVRVDGRQLVVSNLDKVLFPEVGFTKAQVIDYYVRIAPVLLPHLSGRPVTFTRWPDGVEGQAFFEKNSARHAPDWVRRVTVPSPGSSRDREVLEMVLLETVADLAWSANLAALELQVPQW